MTRVNNWLTDDQLAEILSGVVDGVEPTTQELTMAAELQERRKADSVRPVGYVSESAIFCLGIGQHEVITAKPEKDADDARYWDVIPLYAAPPVQETGVYKDMINIISLLENNEWAEHCTSTVLGSLLESEITRLVGKEQLMSVVPDDWQLAPKNPTGPMLAAGYQAYMKGQHRGRFYRSYQAMLEAAPKLSEVDHDDDK